MSRVEIYRETILVADDSAYLGLDAVPNKGKWRWRFIKNGRIMADSGQGYSRRIDALRGACVVLGMHQSPADGALTRMVWNFGSPHPPTVSWERIKVHDLTKDPR